MKWTNEKPTKEGWYWFRQENHHDLPEIVPVIRNNETDELEAAAIGMIVSSNYPAPQYEPLYEYKGQWSDQPIAEPGQDKKTAIAAISALIQHYNITAADLPCLWLSPENAKNGQTCVIGWIDNKDSPALSHFHYDTEAFDGDCLCWFDLLDDCEYINPDCILPIPPLPDEVTK